MQEEDMAKIIINHFSLDPAYFRSLKNGSKSHQLMEDLVSTSFQSHDQPEAQVYLAQEDDDNYELY